MDHFVKVKKCFLFVFWDRASLCSQAVLELIPHKLRHPPASASQVQGLKACATTAQQLLKGFNALFSYYMYVYAPHSSAEARKGVRSSWD